MHETHFNALDKISDPIAEISDPIAKIHAHEKKS